jgi:phosphotriesterase-related protein
LKELKAAGCKTLFECTPAFLGRDVQLLKKLSRLSGIRIITNTGFYGAVNNKFFPEYAQALSPQQIANIWVKEFEDGIDGTGIRPGFMKISVDSGSLSELHQKLVQAAALTHLKTGLTIASHTGPALPAFQEIELLKEFGVHPSAFIWVHAQGESDKTTYVKAAKEGAWISLDGLSDDNVQEYSDMLGNLKKAELLSKVLVSHDAGYYDPSKEDGGSIRRYTTLFDKLVPELKKSGFSKADINRLIVVNPAEAFALKIRRI